MRRADGVCVGHGAWDVAVALVESVGGLVGLGCCFSLPVVASFAPGGGLLWVPPLQAARGQGASVAHRWAHRWAANVCSV